MFTFCFTSVAAAQLRQTRETNKTTRHMAATVRTVKLGLVAMAVLAIASTANAGGHSSGHSGSSGGSGLSKMFSQATQQFKNQASNNDKNSGKKIDSNKSIDLGQFKSDLSNKIGKMSDKKNDAIKLIGNKSDKKIGMNDKISDVVNKMGMGKLSDKHSSDKGKFCDPCCHKEHCCPWWYCWNYPCWNNLYGCNCGCYDDVPVVFVHEGVDLQLLAVRMIDSGDPEQQLGPALRVWFRNNSAVALNHPFNVLALAARGPQPTADLPQAGVRVGSIEAGQTLAIDIRLPVEANLPGFPMFHVVVDSHREIQEVNETNNGLVIDRSQVQPIELAQAGPTQEAPMTLEDGPAPSLKGATTATKTEATPEKTVKTDSPTPVAVDFDDAD
jgi:hypothetical protein